ncbi:MAG: LPS export ABC transporter periplasmic protein LptC [Lentisphaeria bacterium]|nr:LPS export ABC transporter periplasmic protein LptC [Lentisphaeria bacterium]
MTTFFRSFLVASAVFAAFAAVRPSLHAQGFGGAFSSFFSDDEEDNAPVDVSANVADIYLEKNIITLLGNVVVDKKDTKITCDKMEIFLRDKTEKEDEGEKEKKAEKPEEKPAPKPAAVSAVKTDGKEPEKDDKEKDDGMNQNISKLICTGDVVYRQQKPDKPGDDSLALANKGDYDEKTGVIVMTGGHINPQGELPKAMYDDIVRVVGKDMVKEYPIMKQGTNWILGDKIEIFVKDRNHMRVINPRVSSNRSLSNNSTTTTTTNPGSTRR